MFGRKNLCGGPLTRDTHPPSRAGFVETFLPSVQFDWMLRDTYKNAQILSF